MKKSRALELIKTATVAALLVSLICLCTVFIFGFGQVSREDFTKSMMADLKRQSSKSEYSKYFSPEHIVPEFIGISSAEGEHIGMFSDTSEATVKNLYINLSAYFADTFGEKGETTALSYEAGEALWHQALEKDNVYMSFCGELPRSVIYYMTFPDALSDGIGGENISELIIFPCGDPKEIEITDIYGEKTITRLYAFSVVTRNRHGEYYLFETTSAPQGFSDTYFNRERIFSYNTSGAFSFEFGGGSCFSGMDIKTESMSAPEVFILKKDITSSEGEISRAAGAFGINYEKAVRYEESDGAVSYIEEGHNIKLYREGKLVYTATGDASGVRVNSYSESSTVYDYIGAALRLLKASGLCDAENIRLVGVYKNGESTEVAFGYKCNNVSVFDGRADLLRFDFVGDRLVSAEIGIYTLQSTKRFGLCPRRWYEELYKYEQTGDGRLVPFYVAGDGEKSVGAVWLFAKATEESGK